MICLGLFDYNCNVRLIIFLSLLSELKWRIFAFFIPADSPKSLAELADKGNETLVDTETSQSSIAAAAEKYESEHSPHRQNLAEVHVMTGEEDEKNVLQVRSLKSLKRIFHFANLGFDFISWIVKCDITFPFLLKMSMTSWLPQIAQWINLAWLNFCQSLCTDTRQDIRQIISYVCQRQESMLGNEDLPL